jgi:starch synthase (maltosyl-transferring)
VKADLVQFKKASQPRKRKAKPQAAAAAEKSRTGRFFIEQIYPSIDGGRFAVKRIVGERLEVWADVLRDGHDQLGAALLWRAEAETEWRRAPMRFQEQDRWSGSFTPGGLGRHWYAIEAWTDEFLTWRHGFLLKQQAGTATAVDAAEGAELVRAANLTGEADRVLSAAALAQFDQEQDARGLLAAELADAMSRLPPGGDAAQSTPFPLMVDRPRARAGAWYEIFPRSQSRVPGQHGTFEDCIAALPRIAALGFDVLYLTPIHPIGSTNRKGRNNSLTATEDDPGSPYAIGSEDGGHDAIHPELGTLDDFRRLVAACKEYGMEVALDFAIQCSPDHPWLSEHPEWFRRRSDGSIRYAENPPKKYEDIVNPDLSGPHAREIWRALRDVIRFWIEQGVRIFRVDNPHTKPFDFWEWLIRDIQTNDPDVIFLSEAFTRPKIMKALAKLGFTQSYTYFTWRTGKAEIEEYLNELVRPPERDFYRPNFFTNTPDILPHHLQGGERWMFQARAALAATLSGNYGVYSGFELLEHTPLPGREEYLDAEKYEIKSRDWAAPGNIGDYIARLNRIRRDNAALQQTSDLRFLLADHSAVIGFLKESPAHDNAVAGAISVTGAEPKEFWLHFGEQEIGPREDRRRVAAIENLFTGERHLLAWGGIRLRIDPRENPALLFRCRA